ncbi:hypothetical protein [Streptomyces sp. 4F14]
MPHRDKAVQGIPSRVPDPYARQRDRTDLTVLPGGNDGESDQP